MTNQSLVFWLQIFDPIPHLHCSFLAHEDEFNVLVHLPISLLAILFINVNAHRYNHCQAIKSVSEKCKKMHHYICWYKYQLIIIGGSVVGVSIGNQDQLAVGVDGEETQEDVLQSQLQPWPQAQMLVWFQGRCLSNSQMIPQRLCRQRRTIYELHIILTWLFSHSINTSLPFEVVVTPGLKN